MISLKLKYLGAQGLSAFVSIGAATLLYYFCSQGFSNLVGISAKNLDALYTTGVMGSMLWKERSEWRASTDDPSRRARAKEASERVTTFATAAAQKSTSNDFREAITEFLGLHAELHKSMDLRLSRSITPIQKAVFLGNLDKTYDRLNRLLTKGEEAILLESQEQQSTSIRTTNRVMELALFGTIALTGAIFLFSFFYLRRYVINPIVAISKASLDAARGHYQPIENISTTGEITILTDNFNRMMEEIQRASKDLSEFNRQLEAKIEERSAQLLAAEGKLVSAAKMSALGEMAGGIAHEINTPLSTIGILMEQIGDLVEDETLDREALAKRIEKITFTVHRISTIIKGLRAFSRDGSQDPAISVPLRLIVEETLQLCTEKLKYAGIKMHLGEIDDSLRIHCRSTEISQVLLNLIGNACDAIESLSEKWIRIDYESRNGRVRVSVTDSGHGIPAGIRNKLFQPFFTTKEIGKGTGLGLSISKGIIAAHGGVLEIDESSENTRFVIDLPLRSSSKNRESNVA